jgi:signal transduction histidine kinase
VSGRRSSLAGRLLTTLLALGLVLLVVVGLALGVFLSMRVEQRKVTEDYFLTIQDSNAGFLSVLEIEEAAASYLRTGAPEDLARLREAQQPREGAAGGEVLRQRLRESPEALEALERTTAVAVDWYGFLEELLQTVEQDGPQALTEAQRVEQRQRFAELRSEYGTYIDAVLEARGGSVARLQERTTLLFTAVLLAVATSVVAGVLLYTALRTWVTRPVEALAAETRTVRSGALEHQVQVEGPPEIVALADDVEAMRLGLVEQLAELRQAQERLEMQAEELRRSNRDLEQFAYVASHDLQEPLRKVSSFCQMLERRYKGQLDERADQYIAFAVDGAKRMQLLINDLLAFSRVGRISDGVEQLAMADVLADALHNLGSAIEDSGAVVTADELPVVHGERRLLVQLLQNLIGNGLKFRSESAPRIRIEARRDGDEWEFAVCDNGIGIEPQFADRIFVIFQRLHAKSEYDGTGIGLALCKKIVEYHGGHIWIDTSVTEGTRIRWSLPADPEVAPHRPDADATSLPEADATSTPPTVAVGTRKDG